MFDIKAIPYIVICSLLAPFELLYFVDSKLRIQWKQNETEDAAHHYSAILVIYEPPVGSPASNSWILGNQKQVEINDVLPATLYNVTVNALLTNGKTVSLLQELIPTNPDIPSIDYIEAGNSNAVVFLSYPIYEDTNESSVEVSFNVEYQAIKNASMERQNQDINKQMADLLTVSSNQTTIVLSYLKADTWYEVKACAEFNGIQSESSSLLQFRTKSVREHQTQNSNDSISDKNAAQNLVIHLNGSAEISTPSIDNTKFLNKNKGVLTPSPIRDFRVESAITEQTLQSRVVLNWYQLQPTQIYGYEIIVSYFPSKKSSTIANGAKKIVVNTSSNSIGIGELRPVVNYTFVAINVSDAGTRSAPVAVSRVMPPVISSVLLPGKVTSNSLLVTYSPTDADGATFDYYILTAFITSTTNVSVKKSKFDRSRELLLKNLVPGQSYKIALHTVYCDVRSSPVVTYFTTYPLKVRHIKAIIRINSVKLIWQTEETTIENIIYKISYTGSDGSEQQAIVVAQKQHYIFDELKPDTWYTFSVTVSVNEQDSESESLTVATGRASDPVPQLLSSTPTSIKLMLNKTIFPDTNGVMSLHDLILTQDYTLDSYSDEYPTWYDVQDTEIWPPYVTTPSNFNPFTHGNQMEIPFEIGEEKCFKAKASETGERCNGPLKPLTLYYVRLRGCTREEICMESSFTKIATEKEIIKANRIVYLNRSNFAGKRLWIVLLYSFMTLILF